MLWFVRSSGQDVVNEIDWTTTRRLWIDCFSQQTTLYRPVLYFLYSIRE